MAHSAFSLFTLRNPDVIYVLLVGPGDAYLSPEDARLMTNLLDQLSGEITNLVLQLAVL